MNAGNPIKRPLRGSLIIIIIIIIIITTIIIIIRDRFSVALYATEERSPEDEKLYAGQNHGEKKKKKITK